MKRSRIQHRPRRHRELWRTGRLMLSAEEMRELRQEVYQRAEGRCERMVGQVRCNARAPWSGWGHGELHHIEFRSHGGSDMEGNVRWLCPDCHRAEHGRR